VALTLSTLALAAPAAAAPTWLAPVDLSASGEDAGSPAGAMDSSGDVTAVWYRNDGANNIVQASVRQAGGAFGTPVDLSQTGVDAFGPRVAMDPAGDAVAVWFRGAVIQAAARPAGGSFGAAVDVSAVGGNASFPQIAIDDAGEAVAVWYRFDGANNVAQAAIRLPTNGVWQTPVDLSAPGKDAVNATVAMDPAGDAVAVWQRNDGSNQIVQGSYRPAGGDFGAPVDLSAAGQNALRPQVAMDTAGDAVVVWHRSNGTNTIVQASVRTAGGSFSAPVDLSAPGQDADAAQVAMDPGGDAIAIWERSNGTNQIVQASVRPAGANFGAPTDVSLSSQSSDGPQIAMDQAGDATAVWRCSSCSSTVVGGTYRPATSGIWQTPIDLSVSGQSANSQELAMDQAGDATAVWLRLNGANFIAQAAGFDFTGPQLAQLGGLAIPASGTEGRPVAFAVSPLDVWSGATTGSWDFGDGQAASGTSVSHTYAAAGRYRVVVTSTDAVGNSSTSTGSITIAPSPTPTCQPFAVTAVAAKPVTVVLGCSDPGGGALTYSLDSLPAHGTLSAFDPTAGEVVYTAAAGYAGADGFSYHAASPTGVAAKQTVSISVQAPAAPVPPPAITNARLTNERFRVGPRSTAIAANAPVGTRFRFTLSAAAKVQIAMTGSLPGLRSGGRCVAATAKLRRAHAKRCTRTVKAGTLTRANEPRGADSVAFSGRIGGRALAPGKYRAMLRASNANGTSASVMLTFTVVR
jgi:hypothetical protein